MTSPRVTPLQALCWEAHIPRKRPVLHSASASCDTIIALPITQCIPTALPLACWAPGEASRRPLAPLRPFRPARQRWIAVIGHSISNSGGRWRSDKPCEPGAASRLCLGRLAAPLRRVHSCNQPATLPRPSPAPWPLLARLRSVLGSACCDGAMREAALGAGGRVRLLAGAGGARGG